MDKIVELIKERQSEESAKANCLGKYWKPIARYDAKQGVYNPPAGLYERAIYNCEFFSCRLVE